MKKKTFSLICLGIGVFLVVQVIMPILAFKWWEFTVYNENTTLVRPSPEMGNISGISVQNINNFPAFISGSDKRQNLLYEEFMLSVPSINLDKVKVIVDSNNFEQNLALMPGTALPGERGNVFITGHSSLPQFYRPGNFKAIFAHLFILSKD